MPRAASRAGGAPSSHGDLLVYYCLCGEFVLIADRALEQLPVRPLDQSHVLRSVDSARDTNGKTSRANAYKVCVEPDCEQLLKRCVAAHVDSLTTRPDGTVERQFVFVCPRCRLPVGYEHTPPPVKSGQAFTFIHRGTLTYVAVRCRRTNYRPRQGTQPESALLGASDDEIATLQ